MSYGVLCTGDKLGNIWNRVQMVNDGSEKELNTLWGLVRTWHTG